MTDSFSRTIDYMRVSITDRCNLRCRYCMPHDLPAISHDEILRNEEFTRFCGIASDCGVKNIKITGGEPLVRRGCMDLIRSVKSLPKIEHVTLTTNGVLLRGYLSELADISIDGINVSLDTLNAGAYAEMTGKDELQTVLDSIRAAVLAGFKVKVNCVPIRGFNDRGCADIARLAEELPLDVRFIEAMPIGVGKDFEAVAGEEILNRLLDLYPDLTETDEKRGFGPAKYYRSTKLCGRIGFINAVSHMFCESCNRVRFTSEGFLKLCLYHQTGVDFRALLRGRATDSEIADAFRLAVSQKPGQHLFNSGIQAESRVMSSIGG